MTKPIGEAKGIRKGTCDVLKDLAYAQRYMEEFAQGDFAGRLGLEMSFVERALRVATGEIKQLRKRLEDAHRGGAPREERLRRLVEQWQAKARRLRRWPANPVSPYPKSYNEGVAEASEAHARELSTLIQGEATPGDGAPGYSREEFERDLKGDRLAEREAPGGGLDECPRCGNETNASDIVDGRCGECRLHEDESEWSDEAEGPLN